MSSASIYDGITTQYSFYEHNRTPSGKKTVTGVQVITVS